MSYIDIVRAQLRVDEDERLRLYKCSAGKWSIGIGRNLEDKGIRPDEMELMFVNDMKDAEADCKALFPSFDTLSDARKAVLLNMAFNLGRDRLAKFQMFRGAVMAKAWDQAADEMLDSLWAKQVGERAQRLAKMMREG